MLGSVYHNLSQPCSYVPTLRVGAVRPGQVVITGREGEGEHKHLYKDLQFNFVGKNADGNSSNWC